MSRDSVSLGEEEKGHSMLMDLRQKGAETNSGESGAMNLEAERIRSRAESTVGRAKSKTDLCGFSSMEGLDQNCAR